MSKSEIVKSKMAEMLPMLADFAKHEEVLLAALMGLYDAGVTDGRDSIKGVVEDLAASISKIVVAHVKKDALAVKAELDSFVAARCIVTGVSADARSIH